MTDIIQEPKEVKVRKDHICQGCGKEIKKGEKVIYSKYANMDGIYSFYECKKCDDYRDNECSKCDDFEYCIGENYMIGVIRECREESK